LLEKYEGVFPLWLSPVQVRILPVSEKHVEYGNTLLKELIDVGIRTDIDDSNETLGKKVREAKVMKIPYPLVIGDKEVESNMVTVEHREKGKVGEMTLEDFQKRLLDEIKRKA